MTTRTRSFSVLLSSALIASSFIAVPTASAATPTIQGLSRQPSEAAAAALITPSDAVLLLLDHQTGLFQTVKRTSRSRTSREHHRARKNRRSYQDTDYHDRIGTQWPERSADARLAQVAPTRTTSRKGEVSAWDNADFVAAVTTGRKTLVMAGVWTSVCVAFRPCKRSRWLQGLCGHRRVRDPGEMASRTTLARLTQGASFRCRRMSC
jgi:hypothetical protein